MTIKIVAIIVAVYSLVIIALIKKVEREADSTINLKDTHIKLLEKMIKVQERRIKLMTKSEISQMEKTHYYKKAYEDTILENIKILKIMNGGKRNEQLRKNQKLNNRKNG